MLSSVRQLSNSLKHEDEYWKRPPHMQQMIMLINYHYHSPHKSPDSLRFLFYSFSGLTLPSWNRVPIFFPSVCIVCCSLSPMKQLSNNYYRTPTKRNGPSGENILDLESTTYKFFFIEFKLSVIWSYIETHYSGNKLILILFFHYIEILKSSVYSNLSLVEAQHSCSLSRGCRVFFISNLKIEKNQHMLILVA